MPLKKNGFYEFRHPNGILPLIVRLKSKESSITCLYSSVQGFSKLKSARLEMNQETKEVFPYENIKVCHRPGVQNIHTVIDVEGATVAQISTSRAEHAQDVFTAVHPYIQRQQMKKALQDVTISPSAAAVEAQACPKKDKKAKSKARKK